MGGIFNDTIVKCIFLSLFTVVVPDLSHCGHLLASIVCHMMPSLNTNAELASASQQTHVSKFWYSLQLRLGLSEQYVSFSCTSFLPVFAWSTLQGMFGRTSMPGKCV